MPLTTLNIISQKDDIHFKLVEDFKNNLSGTKIGIEYLDTSKSFAVENYNPVLTSLENKLALLELNALPYPLPEQIKVHCVLKAENVNNLYYAILSNSKSFPLREELSALDCKNKLGKVYLVGAGQGDYKCLTLKAAELLKKADIIFYDSLIDKHTLDLSTAEKVFVGKRANMHYKVQKDINQLVFEAALKHKTVVRLKGGDPMVFGHAGEEIAYLEARQIEVESIPGICSPIGAASMANIPLTLRNISNSVAFCSAHEKSKIQVPDTDTIVYFMGANNLPYIADALKKKGKPGNFPMTLFYNIGAQDQEVFYETIDSILNNKIEYQSPLLTIAGEVGDRTKWYKSFQHKPKILFTGTHLEKYSHLGYIYHQPMIALRETTDFSETDRIISKLHSFNWLVFTSPYAVKFFFKRLIQQGKDSRSLCGIKIASIGAVTSEYLGNFGIIPNIQAKMESAEGLVELFKESMIKDQYILLPQSNLAPNFLSDCLKKSGNKVEKIAIYENYMPEINNKVEIENFDQIIFTSPSCVDNFIKAYGKLPVKPKIISKGKATQKRIDYYLKANNGE